MIDGVYVALIKPHIIYILGLVAGFIGLYLAGNWGGWFLGFGIVVGLGILINCLYRSSLREQIKAEEHKQTDWRTLLFMDQTNKAIEREYIEHYTAKPEKDDFEFVPQSYRAYMKREYEVWKEMGSPYSVDGIRVDLAYVLYGKAKAWEAMVKDGVCRPSILDDAWTKNLHINIDTEIWRTWNFVRYAEHITEFNSSGRFVSPWCKEKPNLPDWFPSQAKAARELGSNSKTT